MSSSIEKLIIAIKQLKMDTSCHANRAVCIDCSISVINKEINELKEDKHKAFMIAADNMKRASDNHQALEATKRFNELLLKFVADLEPSVLPEGHRNRRRELLKKGIQQDATTRV